jgi:hypothetical protein
MASTRTLQADDPTLASTAQATLIAVDLTGTTVWQPCIHLEQQSSYTKLLCTWERPWHL